MISTTVQCIVYHISTKRSDQIFNTIVSVIWKNNIIVAVTKTWDWGPFMKDVINRRGRGGWGDYQKMILLNKLI